MKIVFVSALFFLFLVSMSCTAAHQGTERSQEAIGDASGLEETSVERSTPKDEAKPEEKAESVVDSETLSCGTIRQEWIAFYGRSRSCQRHADCVLFDLAEGDCECRTFVGPGVGVAVSKTHKQKAAAYLERYKACFKPDRCMVDVEPANRAECQRGQCVVIRGGCLVPAPEPKPEKRIETEPSRAEQVQDAGSSNDS